MICGQVGVVCMQLPVTTSSQSTSICNDISYAVAYGLIHTLRFLQTGVKSLHIGTVKIENVTTTYPFCKTMTVSCLAPSCPDMDVILFWWLWRWRVFTNTLASASCLSFSLRSLVDIVITGFICFETFCSWIYLLIKNIRISKRRNSCNFNWTNFL